MLKKFFYIYLLNRTILFKAANILSCQPNYRWKLFSNDVQIMKTVFEHPMYISDKSLQIQYENFCSNRLV